MIERLDHVNLQTVQMEAMIAWYGQYLKLRNGHRPPFPFAGAWLYAGDHPVVHLVEVATASPKADDLALEHAAFRARGLRGFLERLADGGEPHRVVQVPDMPLVQVNVWDPDGNHLHIDFDGAEAEGLDLEAFTVSKIEA
ncbi:VOC family protein [Hasllibacter sp. MH4015]|uniref:VOC family protein n=1 Tax=Hasllibacter sp. MH4015 TaxID=2854029 RepID=UPI001CD708BB|nr:VOC family protein [Hasllibacter sp. MH4015]